jgi:hypothetical protein
MREPAGRVAPAHFARGRGNRSVEELDRSGSCFPKFVLDLAPRQLDWIELGSVRRLEQQASSDRLDRCSSSLDLVGAQVVENDDVAVAQRRNEELGHEGAEDESVSGPLDRHERCEAGEVESTEHRRHGSAIARHPTDDAFALGSSPTSRSHPDVRSRFVEEDELLRFYARDLDEERGAALLDVGTLLLDRREDFFLRVRPRRFRDRTTADALTVRPIRLQISAVNSAIVRSGFSSTISPSS